MLKKICKISQNKNIFWEFIMPACNDLSTKYLYEYSLGVKIHIVRCGREIVLLCPFNQYGGRKKTWDAARSMRNTIHKKEFGCDVTMGFSHVKKRAGSLNPELPPRVSYGYSRGEKFYVVASYIENNKVCRKRFNIKKLGLNNAIQSAKSFLDNLKQA